eukprot:m.170154 g.170154  ORF g.170154 m.170154 type:complete len:104 (+) comp13487_c0_seq12:930-1241(+)
MCVYERERKGNKYEQGDTDQHKRYMAEENTNPKLNINCKRTKSIEIKTNESTTTTTTTPRNSENSVSKSRCSNGHPKLNRLFSKRDSKRLFSLKTWVHFHKIH